MLSTNHQLDCIVLLWIHRRQGSAHGSAYGLAPVDDDDDSPVEEMSLVKAKKPLKRASNAKRMIPRRRSHQKTGQRRKRSHYVELCAMCQKMPRKETACWNLLKDHQGWLEVKMPSFYDNKKGRKKSKTSETTSGSASGGFNLNNKADESEEETQEHRPMGRDRSNAKKKSLASSHEGSSSFVDLVADKFFNIKSTK
ncbi:hypothetical protein Tco_1146650 [Tanacetum coccineum]